MAKKKESLAEELKTAEFEKEKPKRKPVERKQKAAPKKSEKKTTVVHTTKDKVEKKIDTKTIEEIEAEAKQVVEQRAAELPPITLPPRGYFMSGDRGVNVEALQTGLNNLIDANIPIDGKLGAETIAAVKKFEQKYGGFANGMFGKTELDEYNNLRG